MSDMMTQEEAMNMSNEQAVQILIPMRNMMCDQNGYPISDAVLALDKAIEALSADRPQEWIPCSERLPSENGKTYLTCLDDSGYEWYQTLTYYDGWNCTKQDRESEIKCVVAWMPIEPWKGADDETD